MTTLPPCPLCHSTFTYEDGNFFICPECSHEWPKVSDDNTVTTTENTQIKDAHGNFLADGDTVVLIKDLKVKGTSSTIKVGTKVKNIRLVSGDHNIDCKITGIGPMKLKSEFVKKA